MSVTLRRRLTIRGSGVEYEFLDPMDCSRDEWKEAHRNRVRGSEATQALQWFGGDDARLTTIDILRKQKLLAPFGPERIGDHEVFEMLERAIDDARILVLKRKAPPPAARAGAPTPQPNSDPPAKRVVLDKFIRVLLFDCIGAAVPGKSGPPSARFEVRAQTGSTYSASIGGGKGDVSGIPGATPSACQSGRGLVTYRGARGVRDRRAAFRRRLVCEPR